MRTARACSIVERQTEVPMRSALLTAGLLIGLNCSVAQAQTSAAWTYLVDNVFDGRAMEPGTGVVSLVAPYRAEDAAVVPMTIRSELPAGSDLRIEKITLLIDENPSPVAAEFTFGDAGTVHAIETRLRVDAYTMVHVVAEASDGKLYMAEAFVKASGGCSSPGLKHQEIADIGEMRFRRFEADAVSGVAEAQIMIRHPNNSGLQRDPLMNYYIPAFFVQDLALSIGGKLLFRMAGGISISENPTFRIAYSAEDGPVTVEAVDTKGNIYEGAWPAGGDAS
jgi:sulfur-oxidizing protein SoxY